MKQKSLRTHLLIALISISMIIPAYSISAAALVTDPAGSGYMVPDYFCVANWAYSPLLTKFIDKLPGLGAASANALGQYIPVAVADTTTYPNNDYYEIAVVQFAEKMHSELPATTLRGYVQISTTAVPGAHVRLLNTDGTPILLPNGSQAYGVDKPHYLGPAILSQSNRPTRIKFYNLLPKGKGKSFHPGRYQRNGSRDGQRDGRDVYPESRRHPSSWQ